MAPGLQVCVVGGVVGFVCVLTFLWSRQSDESREIRPRTDRRSTEPAAPDCVAETALSVRGDARLGYRWQRRMLLLRRPGIIRMGRLLGAMLAVRPLAYWIDEPLAITCAVSAVGCATFCAPEVVAWRRTIRRRSAGLQAVRFVIDQDAVYVQAGGQRTHARWDHFKQAYVRHGAWIFEPQARKHTWVVPREAFDEPSRTTVDLIVARRFGRARWWSHRAASEGLVSEAVTGP